MIKSVKLLSPNPRSWLLRNHVTGRQSANLTDKLESPTLTLLQHFFPWPLSSPSFPLTWAILCYPYHFNTSWPLKQSPWSFLPTGNRRSCSPATPHPVSPVCNGQLGSGDPQEVDIGTVLGTGDSVGSVIKCRSWLWRTVTFNMQLSTITKKDPHW